MSPVRGATPHPEANGAAAERKPEPPSVSDRIARWDERHARGQEPHGFAPAAVVVAAVEGVTPGLGLDLACGTGRNTLFLAASGWRVVAVDGSAVALERVRAEAARRGIGQRIETVHADLETDPPGFAIEPARYDLVCDVHFLHRPLFEAIRTGVRPGGRFVAAIHVAGTEGETGGNPAFTLAPGELREHVERWGWQILGYREGAPREAGHERLIAELVARRPPDAAA